MCQGVDKSRLVLPFRAEGKRRTTEDPKEVATEVFVSRGDGAWRLRWETKVREGVESWYWARRSGRRRFEEGESACRVAVV